MKQWALARRAFTTGPVPGYHAKVRAIPFAFSPEDAITHVGVAASLAGFVGRSGRPNVPFTAIVASLLANYFPMRGFKPLRPTRIQPVYFPTWIVRAELEATAWLSSESNTEEPQSEPAMVQFQDLFLPGFGMDFGRVLIRDPPIKLEHAKPFSPDLAHQWGQDVMCLPFNTFPFDILDKARSLSYNDAVVSENMRFNPQSIKMNLGAAFPILSPAYLVQYVSREPWPPVTVILAAHSEPGVHYIHIPHAEDDLRLPFEEVMGEHDGYIEVGVTREETEVQALLLNHVARGLVSDELSSWLNDKLQQRDAPVSMVSERPVDMDDPRIREWSAEDLLATHRWLQIARAHFLFRATLEEFNVDESQIPSLKLEEAKFLADMFKNLKVNMEEVQKWQETRAALTPEWWRKWEDGQKPPRSR